MQASRYDDHASWFVDYSREWSATSSSLLPADLSGQRVLDLACGWGVLSRDLANRGATVTGVDLSEPLLEEARVLDRSRPERRQIRYLTGDASTVDWWDGRPFAGVVCNMALMDVDDLDATLSTVYTVLERGGWFQISLLHPCFPGDARVDSLPSWSPTAGYGTEGWWTTGSIGVRGHVGANHRKLSTYLNALIAAGLRFTRFTEPDPTLPRILVIDGRRDASTTG